MREVTSWSRRTKTTAAAVTAGLLVVCGVILSTPAVRQALPGMTPDQVALQRTQAANADLRAQNQTLSEQLSQPRPAPEDPETAAQVEDLRAQNKAMSAKLARPGAKPAPDQSARVASLKAEVAKAAASGSARADDLKAQLDDAEAERADAAARAAALGPEQARSADLKAQVGQLSQRLTDGPGPQPEPVVTASLTRQQIIDSRDLFGLYTQQSPFDYSEFMDVEQAVDRGAQVSGYFQSWASPFRPDAVRAAWSRDQVPMLTWESQAQIGVVSSEQSDYSLSSIIAGAHDDYLHTYAAAIHELGLPLVIRFDHEMNGSWYPWSEIRGWDGTSVNGNHAGDYAQMWRHVHDIFEAEGANEEVIWLWAPNRVNKIPSQPDPQAFYPGDAYVDWVGMSAYYRPGDEETSFDYVYGQTLPLLDFAGKPIFLAETGAGGSQAKKAAFIEDFFATLPAHREIIGFGWFNYAVPVSSGTNDWRVNVDPPAREAFREGLAVSGYGRPR